jgi:hypothetical protein
MEKQTNNARSERTPTPPELLVSNKNSPLLSQLQVNNQSTPANKHTRHQPPLSHDSKTINLV